MKKPIISILLAVAVLVVTACSEADRVSENLSREADNFNIRRQLTVINCLKGDVLFQMTGCFSIKADANDSQLEITVRTEDKQNINLGRKTNQNFVSIPFGKLRSMLSYKCKRIGIHYVETEEAHTSKCSFTDRETIEHHDTYIGKRVKRGLFISSDGKGFNADVNGSLNIGRKYLEALTLYTDDLHTELLNHRHNPKVRTIHP